MNPQIKKTADLLRHYHKEQVPIIIEHQGNTQYDIRGIVSKLKTMFGRPYCIIDSAKIFLEDIDCNSIFPVGTKVREVQLSKSERKGIGKSMKIAVWDRYFGDKLRGKCLCCGVQEITRDDCEMCHIISVADGGETTVNNLKPGCKDCNRSMGTMNFDDYKREYHQ